MKIIYDCTTLSKWKGNSTGIQRVVKELGKELKSQSEMVIPAVFDKNNNCYKYSIESNLKRSLLKIERGDIIFSAGHDWDYPGHFNCIQKYISKGVRFGVLFHDIIPILFPFTFSEAFNKRFNFWLKKTLKTAEICLAVSLNTKSDILSYCQENCFTSPKIDVIRLGDHIPKIYDQLIINNGLIYDEPFILSVGTIEYRKNHIALLNAYRYLIDYEKYTPPKLYIVGKQGDLDGDLKRQIKRDHRLNKIITVVSDVSDATLHKLYRNCLFTVYPSIYEGWGLPIAESLYYDKPCIVSRSSSLIEIAHNCVRYANPYNSIEWANHIRKLSENTEERENEIINIKKNYRKMTWKDTASQVSGILKNNII